MILLDDELPGPLSIGQVSVKSYLPVRKSTCSVLLDRTFFQPCRSVAPVKLFKFTLWSVKKNRAIFVWPWKMVSVSVRFFFVSQWMHGLFVFPPNKTLTWRLLWRHTATRLANRTMPSIDWFLESSRAWSFFTLGPVVRRSISANLGLNFNLGFFFLLSKSIFPDNFLYSRASNHQIIGKKNKSVFAF